MEHQFNKKGRHVNLVDGRIVSIRQTDVTSSDLRWTSSFQASALTIVKQIWHVTSPAVYLFILFYLIASTEHEKTRSPYEHAPYLHKHAPYIHKHM